MKLFKLTPEKAAALVAQIEAEIAEAQAERTQAKAACDEASLAQSEGIPGASSDLAKARKALERAKETLETKSGALALAKERYSEALKAEHDAILQKRWDEVGSVLKRRDQLATEVEAAMNLLAAKFGELVEISGEVYASAPAKDSTLVIDGTFGPNQLGNRLKGFYRSLEVLNPGHGRNPPQMTDFAARVHADSARLLEKRNTPSPLFTKPAS
jgi:hypothetical protein